MSENASSIMIVTAIVFIIISIYDIDFQLSYQRVIPYYSGVNNCRKTVSLCKSLK